MLIEVNQTVQKDVEIIEVYAKVSDAGTYTLIDVNGVDVKEHDGYVPSFFPGEHYGDYLIFKIDLKTGRILNWKIPTKEQLEEFVLGVD